MNVLSYKFTFFRPIILPDKITKKNQYLFNFFFEFIVIFRSFRVEIKRIMDLQTKLFLSGCYLLL